MSAGRRCHFWESAGVHEGEKTIVAHFTVRLFVSRGKQDDIILFCLTVQVERQPAGDLVSGDADHVAVVVNLLPPLVSDLHESFFEVIGEGTSRECQLGAAID